MIQTRVPGRTTRPINQTTQSPFIHLILQCLIRYNIIQQTRTALILSDHGLNATCSGPNTPERPLYALTCNGTVSTDACARLWGASCSDIGMFWANSRVPLVDCGAKFCTCTLVRSSTWIGLWMLMCYILGDNARAALPVRRDWDTTKIYLISFPHWNPTITAYQ